MSGDAQQKRTCSLFIRDTSGVSTVTSALVCPIVATFKKLVQPKLGTGYYLNHLEFSDNTSVDLFDIETAPLASAESLLRRQHPNLKVRTRLHDILSNEELSRDTGYDSVGLTYLLHCLPGPGSRKVAIFPKIRDAMSPGGVVFGATVLGRGPWHSLAGGCLLRGLNWIRQFDNLSDTKVVFQRGLEDNFVDVKTWVIGSVLLFEARKSMN